MQEIITKVVESAQAWMVGSFGGFAYYLYKVTKWQPFRFSMFLINIALAFFIGYIVWKFLPDSSTRDGIIGICWFSAFPILDLLERKGPEMFVKLLSGNMKK